MMYVYCLILMISEVLELSLTLGFDLRIILIINLISQYQLSA